MVHADVLEDHDGRSKGCGIVEYDNPHGAMRAIREVGREGGREGRVSVQKETYASDLEPNVHDYLPLFLPSFLLPFLPS